MRNGDNMTLTRAQRGWKCEAIFSAATSLQFTDVPLSYETGGRWWWTALVKCWWGMSREKKRVEMEHAEARREKGWL